MLPLLAALACQAPPVPTPCATRRDGACDEPGLCPYGTDVLDCEEACAVEPWDDAVAGACAHRAARESPEETDPAAGTGGSGGPAGTWDGTVRVRGAAEGSEVERHFRVYAPATLDRASPAPVLFNFGGFRTDLYWLAEYTELTRTADLNGFLVVYGEGEWRDYAGGDVWVWYVYNSDFDGPWSDNPDLGYVRAILEQVGALYDVDRTRVYASGHSRGAALSVIAAFELPGVIAGFCAQSGFADANRYDTRMENQPPDRKVPGVLVHGTADSDVPVEESDRIAEVLDGLGWVEGEDYLYERLPGVTHEWQPQYNQQAWDFLTARPLPLEDVEW